MKHNIYTVFVGVLLYVCIIIIGVVGCKQRGTTLTNDEMAVATVEETAIGETAIETVAAETSEAAEDEIPSRHFDESLVAGLTYLKSGREAIRIIE